MLLHVICEEQESNTNTNCCGPATCVVLFIVSLLPEVLLWMEDLFVNPFGALQLGESCKGWCVQCVIANDTWTHPSNAYCLGLLVDAFMGFFLSLLLLLSFS